MPGKPYIPAKEAEFVEWAGNLLTVSRAHKTAWKLDDSQLDNLDALCAEVKTLHLKCQTAEYTKLDMQAKNEKKALLKTRIEVFVRNNLQNNDAMTDNGRQALQIPIYDRTTTPRPAPDTIPEVEIELPRPRALRIKFRAENAPRWGKPEYTHGLECRWVLADAPPATMEGLVHSEFATKSPLELEFDEEQRGQRIYFAVRWEGNGAKKGPYGDILNAVVP